MVSAWYYLDSQEDPREAHQFSPSRPVSLEELAKLGVLHWKFDIDSSDFYDRVDRLMLEKAYKNRDQVILVHLGVLTGLLNIMYASDQDYDFQGQAAQLRRQTSVFLHRAHPRR